MSRKGTSDPFQPKFSRNDRFAQMSHQEKVIEQKKKEILEKIAAKRQNIGKQSDSHEEKQSTKRALIVESKTTDSVTNKFSNDGSFLNTFNLLKDAKTPAKNKVGAIEKYSSDKETKNNRWNQKRVSQSPKDSAKRRTFWFSDKSTNLENSKITINTSFNTSLVTSSDGDIEKLTEDSSENNLFKNDVQEKPSVLSSPFKTATSFDLAQPSHILSTDDSNLSQHSVPSTNSLNFERSPTLLHTNMSIALPSPLAVITSIPPPNLNQIIKQESIAGPQKQPPLQMQASNTSFPAQTPNTPNVNCLVNSLMPHPAANLVNNSNFITNVPPPNKLIPPPVISIETNLNVPPPNAQQLHSSNSGSNINTQTTDLSNSYMTRSTATSSSLGLKIEQTQTVSNESSPPQIPSLMAQPVMPPMSLMVPNINTKCPPPQLPNFQTPPPVYNIHYSANSNSTSYEPAYNPSSMSTIGQSPNVTLYDMNKGTAEYEAMSSLGRLVAQCGTTYEEVVRQGKIQDPNLWFLFHKESRAYHQYQELIENFKRDTVQPETEKKYNPDDIYEPEAPIEDDDGNDVDTSKTQENDSASSPKKIRKSRWGGKVSDTLSAPTVLPSTIAATSLSTKNLETGGVQLSKITRNDPNLINYAINTYGSKVLNEEEWKNVEENYKMNLMYQEMLRKKKEADMLYKTGKNKYEYDSDEDTDGGTWEHKLRTKEMVATQQWATEITKHGEGKHHIGDFLPPEEFKKLLDQAGGGNESNANVSDYKEHEIKEDNIGFKMLQKLGWSEGQGLGTTGTGIVEPVNKTSAGELKQGLGLGKDDTITDEYEAYRKRMMLAYRFRPNPLNNPRRPYY